MKMNIRLLYLYLFSFVGLIISVVGAIRLLELGLKVYVFKEADNYYYVRPAPVMEDMGVSTEEANLREKEEMLNQDKQINQQRQREAAGALAMLFVGIPLYKYHWGVIQKENKKNSGK